MDTTETQGDLLMKGLSYLTLSAMGLMGPEKVETDAEKAQRLSAAAAVTSKDGPPVPRYSSKREYMPKLKGKNRRVW